MILWKDFASTLFLYKRSKRTNRHNNDIVIVFN